MLRLAPRRVLLSAVVIFMSTEPGLGLLSDYKTCGDPQCESLLSRVLATRDHKARDCRFLSFNRGDSIFVYHKLSGKRDDLWAGSIGKHFGYFPKDAVEVEEVYAPKEVQISTKEQDFFCLDGNGGFIESEITFSEREEEAQKAPTGELEYPERSGSERDSLNDFTNNEGTNSDSEVQLPPDIEEPKAAEQGGSYWLGSGVTGWLGLGGQKDDSATDETEGQDSFKSRKLALTDNMLQEEAGWLGGRLSNAFGFSKGSEEIQPDEEDEKDRDQSLVTSTDRDAAEGLNANEEKVTEAPSRSWLKFGVPEVLKFGQRSSDENAEGNGDLTEAERYPSEEKEVGSPSQDFSVSRGGEDLERTEKDIEVDITHDKEDKKGENAGWYSSVYNKIAGFHRAEDDTANDIHLSQESLGTGSQEEAEEVKDDTEQESQSVLSFGGMKNMFGTLTSRFQQQSSDANKEPTSADEEYVLSKEVSQESNISETKNIPDVQNGSEEQTSKLEENDQPDIQPDAQKVQDGELIGSNLEENLETVDLPLASDLELKTSSEGHVEIPEDTEKDIDRNSKPPSHCFTDSCTREKHIDEGAGRGTLQSTASRGSEKTVKSESLRDLGKGREGQTLEAAEASIYQTTAQDGRDSSASENTTEKITSQMQGDSEIGRVLSLAAQAISEACESAKPSWSSFSQFMQRAVSSLPEDMRPGPDIYGLPWEAVIITAVLGGITILMFFCRSLHSIKSRLYVGKEKKLGQKVAELLEEKCKVLETLSECKQKYDKLEDDLKNGALSDQASERENLQEMCKKLEESNTELLDELDRLEKDFESQKATRSQQDELLAEMQLSLKNMEEEAREQKSQMEQAHTTLKVYEINSERLKKNLQAAKEENCHLQESKDQLLREAEGWDERLNDLAEQMRMCESSRSSMQEDCSNKDKHIKTLTERLLKMKDWDSELEEEADGKDNNGKGAPENGDGLDTHQREKIQKLIHAAKMSADLKSMEEEKNRVFARLADEAKAKEDLKDRIEHLHAEKVLLESESVQFLGDTQKLQQKLQIMTEMYQENELKLHRKLTVEGKERLQKEEKLTRADEKICMAAEELSSYRQRSKELEEELERTKQAYNNQIAAHEKKSHDNWLAARAADRDLTDIKRENSHLRQKMTDAQFKLELVERDPYALDVPGRSLFRGERSPFGPSPLGRPSSETRAFLSPPTLLDGPLRLSPQFAAGPGGKVSRGLPNLADQPVHSEGLDCDRSLDTQRPHSDSGSLSPTWERDWRVHVPPPGYPYTDPGMPYRRPPPGVFPMGPLPPRLPGPAEPHGFSLHPADTPEASFLGNSSASSGAADSDSKDSLPSVPGGLRMPPDADPRMGPGPGPPMRGPFPPPEHRDLFPRRGPYGPPDFYPPRGAPPVGMRGLPPPGMFHQFPPPPPHHMGYQPGRPPPDSVQGPPPRPSPPGSEQSGDQLPPPQDNI
ncbi:cTAGE family member 5 isoform X4 [Amia ocellicauda]|uniref:cTAGE family member 5 isoform X4 n=1 Tax=Amia ocellicauda TaxID=2972642 RepID=UPI00346467CA